MAECDSFIQGLKVGKGCSYGHETRIMLKASEERMNDMKSEFKDIRKELRWVIYLIIALIFTVGGDLVTKLLPALTR